MLFKKITPSNPAPFQRHASFLAKQLSEHPIIQARANAQMAGAAKATVPVVAHPFDPASIKPVNPNEWAIVPFGFWDNPVKLAKREEPPIYAWPQDGWTQGVNSTTSQVAGLIPPVPGYTPFDSQSRPLPLLPGTFLDQGNFYSYGRASDPYAMYAEIGGKDDHEYAEISDVVDPGYAHLSTFKQKEDTATTASVYERLKFSPREESVSTQKAAPGYEQWDVFPKIK